MSLVHTHHSVPSTASGINRVRSGCWTCRARRIKCNEQKPICLGCTKKNLICRGLGYAGGIHESRPRTVRVLNSAIPRIPSHSPQLCSSQHVKDILHLVPLMVIELNRAEDSNLITKAIRVQGVGFFSYIQFLPPTAGHDAVLDSASRCLAAALRDYFQYSPPALRTLAVASRRPETLLLYASAIKQLSIALTDETRSKSIEILCATILLLFFEAIYNHTTTGVITHANGALQLIKHHGPSRFTTDFEKLLLASQFPTIMRRSLFNNTPVPLETEHWRPVLQSCITPSHLFGRLNDAALGSLLCLMPVTDIFASTTALLTNKEQSQQQKNEKRIKLLQRIGVASIEYHEWNSYLLPPVNTLLTGPTQPTAPHITTTNTANTNLWIADIIRLQLSIQSRAGAMFLSRLAVVLGAEDADQIECRVQQAASDVLAQYSQIPPYMMYPGTLIAVEKATRAILNTADEWRRLSMNIAGGLIDLSAYCGWLRAMGMTLPE